MAEPVIQVRGLSKDFLLPHLRRRTIKSHFVSLFKAKQTMEVQHALRDIDLDVGRGEFLGVVGRNGCGKSTLLKTLAGIYQPSSGQVSITGRLVPFIELGVGFNPELTGRENVYLNGALLGFSKDEVDKRYGNIVEFAELEDSMDQKLKNYSSGMQVRLAFSVATRAKADILLIDEVLAVGDTAFQRKCFDHFRALKKSATTIVFVTHDMDAVREFCDRAVLIEDSRLIVEGSAEAVASEYTKLFNPSAQDPDDAVAQTDDDPSESASRWGDRAVRFTQVNASGLRDEQEPLCITMEAEAETAVDDLCFGFMISNAAGSPALGTNSFLKRRRLDPMTKGQRIRVTWTVPNIFSDGLHFVTIAITDREGFTVHDWWDDATTFTVFKEEKTPYIVTPDADLSIEILSDHRD
jgi:ABC-2 type transport system ATP-binding protein